MTEDWHPVPNYEGLYGVDVENGAIRSLPRISLRGHRLSGRILKPYVGNHGYYCYQLSAQDGSQHQFLLHQLVAEVAIGPRPGKCVIDHIDRNKLNNCCRNLRYVTQVDNSNNNGSKGYYFCQTRKKYVVQMAQHRFHKRYDTEDEAIRAVEDGRRQILGEIKAIG